MTKAVTILALACVLVVGAVITGILCQGSLPSAGAEMPLAAVASMVPNRAAKQDKLTVAPIVVASLAPSHGTSLSEPLRQTSASADDADMEARKALTPAAPVAPMVSAPIHESRRSDRSKSERSKREPASRPVRKSNALLSDAQIARIKERLKLSSSQEYYWPPVAAALRAIARKARAAHRAHPNDPAVPIDPDS
ncbi:MAG: hypothetical protein ACRECL_03065, partial [Bradyrhizobium sp.]